VEKWPNWGRVKLRQSQAGAVVVPVLAVRFWNCIKKLTGRLLGQSL
jgi:hypothetical protein